MSGVRGRPFPKGASGNPGGKPAVAELSALARRYTADAMRALVDVSRAPRTASSLSAIARAGELLLDFGYPGVRKSDGGIGVVDLGELHLLAAKRIVPLEPVPDVPDSALAANMLPPATTLMPEEAGPLWEAAAEREQLLDALSSATSGGDEAPGIELDAALEARAAEGIHGNGVRGSPHGTANPLTDGNVDDPEKLKQIHDLYRGLRQGANPAPDYGRKSPGFTDDP